jgi:hypothetical protein
MNIARITITARIGIIGRSPFFEADPPDTDEEIFTS